MKKTLLLLFLFMGLTPWLHAQFLTENFEGATFPPSGWLSYHIWNNTSSAPLWTTSSSAQSGTKSAFLNYQPTPSGMKYDYLISPQVTPTISNHVFSFYQTTGFPGNDGTLMEVRVSTQPVQLNAIINYTTVASYYDYQLPYVSQGWSPASIDLSAYVGQAIYIYFVVSQFNNGDKWYIDNITTNTISTSCTIPATINKNICPTQSYLFNGVNLNTAGSYLDTLVSAYGCDSILTLNLTVGNFSTTINQTICAGTGYLFNGVNRTQSGTYLDTLVAVGGCDSLVTLNLTVTPPLNGSFNQTICQGGSFLFNGINRTTAGAYMDTLSTAAGCDSIVTLYLNVTPAVTSSFSQSICSGSSYFFNGLNRTTAGAYLDTLSTVNGCDSVVTLNLSLLPAPSVTATAVPSSVCPGDSLKIVAGVPGANNDITFTGSTYLDCGPMPSLNNASAFTVEAMIYYTASTSKRIFLKNNTNSTDGISCDQHGGFQNLSFNIGAGGTKATGTTANFVCSANAWHHVAYVFDGTATGNSNRMKIYVDGNPQALSFVNTVPSTTPSYNTNAIIGRSVWEGFSFIGKMNDVRIWNVARTQAQIQSNMNTCLSGSTSGLLAEYKLNEASGSSVATNSAGSNNQASLLYFNTSSCWNASTSGCNPVNYNVPLSGGITSNVLFVPSATTTYTASVTGGNGCVGTATATATVNPLPSVVATSNLMLACSGSINQLQASGAATYIWNGVTASSDTILNPATAGTYTVQGTSSQGCKATTTITILPDNGNNSLPSLVGSTTSMTLPQTDNSTIRYTDNNCRSIVTIQDAPGGNTLGNVTASVHLEQYFGTYNGQNYVRRTYKITPTNQGPAIVTLYFTQTDFDYYNLYNPAPKMPIGPSDLAGIANIRITKVSGGTIGIGTASVITPTAVIWNAGTNNWEVTFPVNSFSEFYLHAVNVNNSALPVQLSSFNVIKVGTENRLNWTTSSELNNKQFHVQRSKDGKQFETLNIVNSQAENGTSHTPLHYQYMDESPLLGMNYYRLIQEDQDGKMAFSQTIHIGADMNSIVRLYPNPIHDQLFVDVFMDNSEQLSLQLLNVTGQIILNQNFQVASGWNQIQLDTKSIPSGYYHFRINYKQQTMYQQPVIK